jgi:hypothetical protein
MRPWPSGAVSPWKKNVGVLNLYIGVRNTGKQVALVRTDVDRRIKTKYIFNN